MPGTAQAPAFRDSACTNVRQPNKMTSFAGRGEIAMSRHPGHFRAQIRADETFAEVDNALINKVAADAVTHFGPDAATAAAFCGIDAWFEGNDDETRHWTRILERLQN